MKRSTAVLAALLAVAVVCIGIRLAAHGRGDGGPAHPPAAARRTAVTLPEGRSVRETARLVARAGVRGSYIQAARRSPRAVPGLGAFAAPRGIGTLEGFLLPGTYRVGRATTARELVDEQLAAFRRQEPISDARPGARRTPYEVLIVASLLDREAAVVAERRLVAAVIYNRLRHGMPLAIDATLRYHLNNWSQRFRISNREAQSPFNTSLHRGLPPTPIGNPGLASLKAAADPAHVGYLYYALEPCGHGTHAFSSSHAQFERDVAAYDEKRNELGGRDPTRC